MEHATPAPDDAGDPTVAVRVTGEPMLAYRPPETVVRRGWYRDEPVRRQYDREKCEMHDADLGRVWPNQYGTLSRWLAEALAAGARAKLLKMIVE